MAMLLADVSRAEGGLEVLELAVLGGSLYPVSLRIGASVFLGSLAACPSFTSTFDQPRFFGRTSVLLVHVVVSSMYLASGVSMGNSTEVMV